MDVTAQALPPSNVEHRNLSSGGWLYLIVSVSTAGIGIAFGAISIYYLATLKGVDSNAVDTLVQTSALIAGFFVVIAALLAGSWFALRQHHLAIGGIVGGSGLAALLPYLLFSPFMVFLTDNLEVANNGALFFGALLLSWLATVVIGIAGLIGLIGMERTQAGLDPGAPRSRPIPT